MMEREDDDDDVLQLLPWAPVSISGSPFLAKTWFGDTAYHILLTDMHCVWEETMDSTAIQQRAQELNKRLRAPVRAFFANLCKVVRPALTGQMEGGQEGQSTEPEITLARPGEGLTLRLKSELAGLPVYWEFRCSPTPVALVCSQLVRPLLVMSRLLQRQVGELGSLLARKDLEIQDYRENGATLSRERLQTEPFDEQSFREHSMAQALPQISTCQQDSLGFDSALQDLHTAVVSHANSNRRKRTLSKKHDSGDEDPRVQRLQPDPLASSAHLSGMETDSEPSQKNISQPGDTVSPQKPGELQSAPVMAATPDKLVPSKPKKKKARGLFR